MCNFAHGDEELRRKFNLERTKMCLNGKECQDPNCRYAHEETELRRTNDRYKTSLCIQYQKGHCRDGE